MSKYRVFSGSNTGKYGLEKTPCLDTFHAVTFDKHALNWRGDNGLSNYLRHSYTIVVMELNNLYIQL